MTGNVGTEVIDEGLQRRLGLTCPKQIHGVREIPSECYATQRRRMPGVTNGKARNREPVSPTVAISGDRRLPKEQVSAGPKLDSMTNSTYVGSKMGTMALGSRMRVWCSFGQRITSKMALHSEGTGTRGRSAARRCTAMSGGKENGKAPGAAERSNSHTQPDTRGPQESEETWAGEPAEPKLPRPGRSPDAALGPECEQVSQAGPCRPRERPSAIEITETLRRWAKPTAANSERGFPLGVRKHSMRGGIG